MGALILEESPNTRKRTLRQGTGDPNKNALATFEGVARAFCLHGYRLLLDGDEVHDEDDGFIGLDRSACATRAISKGRRDDDLSATADLHTSNTLGKTWHDCRERKGDRGAIFPGLRCEVFTGLPGGAYVFDLYRARGGGNCSGADNQILGEKGGRSLA